MKYVLLILTLIVVTLTLSWKSYVLQDGYKLSGFITHHGWVFDGLIKPVITEEVMGIQGCKNGYIHGWAKSDGSFVIDTNNKKTMWFTAIEQNAFLKSIGYFQNNMANGTNLAGLQNGESYVSL